MVAAPYFGTRYARCTSLRAGCPYKGRLVSVCGCEEESGVCYFFLVARMRERGKEIESEYGRALEAPTI